MASTLFPVREPIADPTNAFLINERWQVYFRDRETAAAANAGNATTPIQLTSQDAAIGLTAFPAASLSAGLYRATYYAHITAADGVSSSLQVSFVWTDGTITCSTPVTGAFAPITGDTLSTTGSGTYLIRIDGGSPVSYSTAYASNTPGQMTYDLSLVLEQIGQ